MLSIREQLEQDAPLLTTAQVAERLQRDSVTVTDWINHGYNGVRLEAFRVGRRWMVSLDALARFLESMQDGPRVEREQRPTRRTDAAILERMRRKC